MDIKERIAYLQGLIRHYREHKHKKEELNCFKALIELYEYQNKLPVSKEPDYINLEAAR